MNIFPVPPLNLENLYKNRDSQVRFSTNVANYEPTETSKSTETPDTPDTPKTPKSQISPIRLYDEPNSELRKKKFKMLKKESSSSSSNRNSKSELIKNSDPTITRRLSTTKTRKYYLHEATNEDALIWVCSIINQVNEKDLKDPKTQYVAKKILEKSNYELLEEYFLKFDTFEKRICFLKLLIDDLRYKFVNLCTSTEIDDLIDSVEENNRLPKKAHFEKYNQIINSLSKNRKADYFKILNDPNDLGFIKAVESCSPSKLNVTLSNIWLKNIPALQKAVSISKMLDCPEGTEKGNIGTNVPSRDIAWRCDQLNSTHLAAIFPILSTQTVKDLRRLGKIKYINEQLAYSEMDYQTFVTIANEGKLHPNFSDDPLFLLKILKLKNNSEERNALKTLKPRLAKIEVQLSELLFETKRRDRESISLLTPTNHPGAQNFLPVTNHLLTE